MLSNGFMFSVILFNTFNEVAHKQVDITVSLSQQEKTICVVIAALDWSSKYL